MAGANDVVIETLAITLLAQFSLVLKSPDFWRLKNQALYGPKIGHWS